MTMSLINKLYINEWILYTELKTFSFIWKFFFSKISFKENKFALYLCTDCKDPGKISWTPHIKVKIKYNMEKSLETGATEITDKQKAAEFNI